MKEIDRADIAVRLIEERTRVGYSQADFARKLDFSREGVRLYENGQRSINAEFLAQAASLGIDVLYVLTGTYAQPPAQPKNTAIPSPEGLPSNTVNIGNGSANILQSAQSGANVTMINTRQHITKTVAEVKPGVDHIDEKQAASIKDLVNEIVEQEKLVKQKPSSYQSVWGALNHHMRVPKYSLISRHEYDKAIKYLRQWIGRLNSQKSAPKKMGNGWRTRKYSYIKINTKGHETWLSDYLSSKFGVESISQLSDEDLDRTYRAVAAKKKSW